jgi:hypothetical protein
VRCDVENDGYDIRSHDLPRKHPKLDKVKPRFWQEGPRSNWADVLR